MTIIATLFAIYLVITGLFRTMGGYAAGSGIASILVGLFIGIYTNTTILDIMVSNIMV